MRAEKQFLVDEVAGHLAKSSYLLVANFTKVTVKDATDIRNAKRLQVGENDGKPIYSDERDPSIPDHALDCVRYVVNSHPIAASAPIEDKKMTATAVGSGRVIVTLPPIENVQKPPKSQMKRWRSRGGGY
jgi:hypothetical protein